MPIPGPRLRAVRRGVLKIGAEAKAPGRDPRGMIAADEIGEAVAAPKVE